MFKIVESILSDQDFSNICLEGRIVRLYEDDIIQEKRVCSVLTEQGILFKDVILTSSSPFGKAYPYIPADLDLEGSRVIIAFLNGSKNKPFILKFLDSREEPSPQSSVLSAALNLLYTSILDDQQGLTTIQFKNDKHILSLNFSGKNTTFKIFQPALLDIITNSISLDVLKDIQIKAESLSKEIKEIKEKIEKLELEWKEFKIKSDKGEFEIDEVKLDNDSVKGSIDEINIESKNKVVLKSKNINLSSDNPADAPVLFNQLQQILTELLTQMSIMTVTCSAPGSPSTVPVNTAAFINLIQRLNNLKSKYIKID